MLVFSVDIDEELLPQLEIRFSELNITIHRITALRDIPADQNNDNVACCMFSFNESGNSGNSLVASLSSRFPKMRLIAIADNPQPENLAALVRMGVGGIAAVSLGVWPAPNGRI